MGHFKLTIAYDGTAYVGWQRQAAGTSIQGLVEEALRPLDDRDVVVTGAGRTDAGVHALGQVASVTLTRTMDPDSLVRAVNARLPPAVRVLDAAEAPPSFHARFGARRKTYRYRIWNGEVISPFERAYAWHLPAPPLDFDRMTLAAASFQGRHDFAAFQSSGSDTVSTERVVFSSMCTFHVEPQRGAFVTLEVSGDGFLRHMVRTMAGTLVEVGRGRRPAAWVGDVLASRDRAQAGPTAPPRGLFLVRVDYDEAAPP